jgi:PAS domain S-box-containing protein
VWSTPIFATNHHVLGTFAVYSPMPGAPSKENLRFVDLATRLASIAVERYVTEHALRESELRFSKTFYANPAVMAITRYADDRILYVNDAFVRALGYTREEAIGQTAGSLLLYAEPDRRALLRELVEQDRLRDIDVKIRTKFGEIRDFNLA